MIYSDPRDQAVDDAAVAAFTDTYGERAASLPPVAIVIAAYNEASVIGRVISELSRAEYRVVVVDDAIIRSTGR